VSVEATEAYVNANEAGDDAIQPRRDVVQSVGDAVLSLHSGDVGNSLRLVHSLAKMVIHVRKIGLSAGHDWVWCVCCQDSQVWVCRWRWRRRLIWRLEYGGA
jgi:hypothetical protein